jgi:hypothetical protein
VMLGILRDEWAALAPAAREQLARAGLIAA